ncbi:glycine cleavage system H-protein subunit [Puttea exsequens]|nr:glycine cleavage system H-protein subunit [Puttea exsequens]
MASFAKVAGSLSTAAATSSRYYSPTARLAPQLQNRILGTKSASFGARAFTTSRALEEKKYTTDHEWIELSSDGKTGTIGVSTYAAKNLGDVVFVEAPAPGLEVNAGDAIGAVESVKSASDIMSPVSGKIIEANDVLQEKPGTINKGPEAEGWIARIEVKDKGEVGKLMGEVEYGRFTAE